MKVGDLVKLNNNVLGRIYSAWFDKPGIVTRVWKHEVEFVIDSQRFRMNPYDLIKLS